ncbi:MAG: head maturation protease, ClpP-related [Syntrophomonas sp.]
MNYKTDKNARAISAFWGKQIDNSLPYQINSLSTSETEIFIYDVLGFPFNDINSMVKEISQIKSEKMTIRINSPGGDIIDCFALFQAIKEHPAKVTVRIEALAASAASIIAMAGDTIEAYRSSFVMIHNAWAFTAGNQYELNDLIDLLKKIDANMIDIYHARSKLGKRELADMMKATSFFNAKEAKAHGLIDTILNAGSPAEAKFDLSMFASAPDTLQSEQRKPTERTIERALRDAGMSRSEAKALLAGRQHDESYIDEKVRNLEEQIAAQNTLLKFKGM